MRGRVLREALARAFRSAEERAAARGAATGHTAPGYRGMRNPWSDEKAAQRAAEGKPFWFSRKPDMAESYAGEKGAVLPAQLRLGKALEVDAKGARWGDIDARAVPDKDVTRRLRNRMRDALKTSYVSSRDLADAARAAGYDSLIIKNMTHPKGDVRRRGIRAFLDRFKTDTDDVMAVFEPKNVRARHARFDPKRRDENNLLAGVTAGAAIPAGAAGLDALRRRREQMRRSLSA